MKRRLYFGATVVAKERQTGKEIYVDASALTHLVLAKSKKEAERKANREARSHYGRGYTLQTEMGLFADLIRELKREEGYG